MKKILSPLLKKAKVNRKYVKKSKNKSPNSYPLKHVIFLVIIILNCIVVGVIIMLELWTSNKRIADVYPRSFSAPIVPVLTDKQLSISAQSAIVFEKESRVVVYEKESNYRFTPASTTKIMTTLLALENYDLDSYVRVPDDIRTVEGSSMGLVGGESVQMRTLLYGMMLPSGNDAAYFVASLDPKGRDGFVAKMNEKARELKMFNTRFVDSSGYDDSNYTTAFDLARLASYALDNPTFATIVQTRSIVLTDQSGLVTYHLSNLNELLADSGVIGIKTGFTNEAGQVLVTSFVDRGRTYIIVVLKSTNRFADTRVIMDSIKSAVQLIQY